MPHAITDTLKIALAQLNPVVGDLAGNAAKLRKARAEAAAKGADLVVFPSCSSPAIRPRTSCASRRSPPPRARAIEALAAETGDGGPGVIVGTIWAEDGKLYNSVALLDGGRVEAVRHKVDLPNYGVFDEKRVFDQGPMPGPVSFRGVRIGVPICEDIWKDEVCECLQETGSEMLISPNGSPFDWPKPDQRMNVAVARVTETGLPLLYLNQIGGQDELVFDGASFVLNADCRPRRAAAGLGGGGPRRRDAAHARAAGAASRASARVLEEHDAAAYHACMLGLRDYVDKNGFPGVVHGAVGRHRLRAGRRHGGRCAGPRARALRDAALPLHLQREPVAMPPTAPRRWACATTSCRSPTAGRGLPGKALAKMFAGRAPDITEENMQSRVRGTALMAISNKFGGMVVTTGNKSEMSVGYATLYGDMNGGFNPIKDLYKMEVYRLCALAQRARAQGRQGAGRRRDPGEHHHPAADGGAAREPDRPGLAAALRGAGRHPGLPGRAARCRSRTSSRAGMRRRSSRRSSGCSTSPSTSAGRRRRA